MYRAGARINLSPLVLDEMEVWQIAAAFGTDDDTVRQVHGLPSGRNLVAERIAHAKGEGPAPEADAPGPEMVELLTRLAIERDEDDGRSPGGT